MSLPKQLTLLVRSQRRLRVTSNVRLVGLEVPCYRSASIVAKVTRDRMMREIDTKYPQYGFKDHKGYGTKAHCQAIEKYGPCEYHRMTFAPIKYMDLSKYE